MPEGDTVRTLATYLAGCLPGRVAERVILLDRPSAALTGIAVTSVAPLGKDLLLHFANGQTLRSHLGLHGSWHRYPADGGAREESDQPGGELSIELTVGGEVFACFNAREVEVFPTGGVRHRELAALPGGDLLAAGTIPTAGEHPLAPLARRARALYPPTALVVDVLLDQRIAAGVGNVCKSEALFLEGIAPTRPLSGLSTENLEALFERARDLLSGNLGSGARDKRQSTSGAGSLWVYSRTDLPCHVCRTPIRAARLGDPPRGTFWCPACQPR
jgi:endonuclease-8